MESGGELEVARRGLDVGRRGFLAGFEGDCRGFLSRERCAGLRRVFLEGMRCEVEVVVDDEEEDEDGMWGGRVWIWIGISTSASLFETWRSSTVASNQVLMEMTMLVGGWGAGGGLKGLVLGCCVSVDLVNKSS